MKQTQMLPSNSPQILLTVAILGLIGFSITTTYTAATPFIPTLLLLSLLLYGGCALTCYPLTLELVVETQFPAPEATAAGLVFLVGQIVGAITLIVGDLLATPATAFDLARSTCEGGGSSAGYGGSGAGYGGSGAGQGNSLGLNASPSPPSGALAPRDLSLTNVFLCALASASCCLFVLGLHADYVRSRVEKRGAGNDAAEKDAAGSGVAFDEAGEGNVAIVSFKRVDGQREGAGETSQRETSQKGSPSTPSQAGGKQRKRNGNAAGGQRGARETIRKRADMSPKIERQSEMRERNADGIYNGGYSSSRSNVGPSAKF